MGSIVVEYHKLLPFFPYSVYQCSNARSKSESNFIGLNPASSKSSIENLKEEFRAVVLEKHDLELGESQYYLQFLAVFCDTPA